MSGKAHLGLNFKWTDGRPHCSENIQIESCQGSEQTRHLHPIWIMCKNLWLNEEFLALSENFGSTYNGTAKDTHGPCHSTVWHQPKYSQWDVLQPAGDASLFPGLVRYTWREASPGATALEWYFLVLELGDRLSLCHLPRVVQFLRFTF